MNRGKWILVNLGVIAFLIYDLAPSIEAPSRAVEILHYVLLALAIFGLIGSVFAYAAQKWRTSPAADGRDMAPK